MAWFKTVGTITGHQLLMDEIATRMVAASWTRTTLDARSAATVLVDGTTGREELFEAPGSAPGAGDPAQFWVTLFMADEQSFGPSMYWQAMLGVRHSGGVPAPVITSSNATRSGLVVTVTATAHGLVTGDHILFMDAVATGAPGWHQLDDGTGNPTTHVVTFIDANNFSFSLRATPAEAGPVTNAKIVPQFNVIGSRSFNSGGGKTGISQAITDAAMDVFGFVNERAFAMMIVQGVNRAVVAFGEVLRDRNIQADEISRAKLAAQVVGDGATPQIITLDRNSPNLYVGQQIQLSPKDSAIPNTISNAESALETTTITQIDSVTQIRAVLSANTFEIGCLIGNDPDPVMVAGTDGIANGDLSGYTFHFGHEIDGSRSSPVGQTFTAQIFGTAQESEMDPDGNGRRTLEDIFFTSNNAKGIRGPMLGCYGVSEDAGWNAQDIFRTGDPALAPAGDYMGFKEKSFNATYKTAFGPDAA